MSNKLQVLLFSHSYLPVVAHIFILGAMNTICYDFCAKLNSEAMRNSDNISYAFIPDPKHFQNTYLLQSISEMLQQHRSWW